MSALSARHPITRVAELAAARPVAAVGPAADIHREIILVVDFGSQYTRLIARRVREAGVYCEIHPWHTAVEKLAALAPKAVILSGGPDSLAVSPAADAAALLQRIAELNLPLLGICYGMQRARALRRWRSQPRAAPRVRAGHGGAVLGESAIG